MRRVALHVVGVARQRVAGDVEAERLLLLGEALPLGPLFLAEDALFGWRRLARAGGTRGRRGEEPELSRLAVLLRGGPLGQRGLDRVPERLARLAGEVERARRDQRLDHLLVDLAHVGARAEVEQPRERFGARGEDPFDGVLAHAFDGAEPEADELLAGLVRVRSDAEGEIGVVDVRRQYGDAVGACLSDVRHHLVRVVLLRSEERRHKLDGMVRLEKCSLVRDEAVRRGV